MELSALHHHHACSFCLPCRSQPFNISTPTSSSSQLQLTKPMLCHRSPRGNLPRMATEQRAGISARSLIVASAGQPPPLTQVTETQQTESPVKPIKSLEKVQIVDLDENIVAVTDLWKDRRVVIGFTRHFGCVLCMKRADLLASRKAEMDAAGVALIIIGPGNVQQARSFVKNTKFPGEVYADPNYLTHQAFEFVSGVGTIFTPMTGMNVISAYLEGYRQDWGLSFQKDTVSRGGWQQGGVLVAGPGADHILFLFKDAQAGDEPNMEDVVKACCAA